MSLTAIPPFPSLHSLPSGLPLEGAVRIELVEGIPIFRASGKVQKRIESLLSKQQGSSLSADELLELNRYEEVDDYLSYLNRVVRNLAYPQGQQDS